MNFVLSNSSIYHSPAASGALAGGMWNLTVTERPLLAIQRKGSGVRTEEIVNG